ncbi:MAG: hypothetical protein AAGE90_11455 [Pseudomonadota bacterium]
MDLLRQPVLRRPTFAPAPAGLAARQEAPELFAFLGRPDDPGVDRLDRDGAQPPLDAAPQTAGDLLRRPAFGEAVGDIACERGVPFEHCRPLAAQKIGSVGDLRAVGAARTCIAPQLAADGRRRSPEGLSNGPKAQT